MSLEPDDRGFTRPDMFKSGSISGDSRSAIAAPPVLTRSSQITVAAPPETRSSQIEFAAPPVASSLQLALSRPSTDVASMETSEHINAATRKVEDVHSEVSEERRAKRNRKEREQQGSEMVQFGEEQQREQENSSDYLLQGDPELWQEFTEEDF